MMVWGRVASRRLAAGITCPRPNRIGGAWGVSGRWFADRAAGKNQRVACHMSVEHPDRPGELALDTRKGEGFPLSFVIGQGQVIPGLEAVVEGMKEGDEWSGVLEPMQAFGIRTDKAIVKVKLDEKGEPPQKGHVVHMTTEFGPRVGRVLEVQDGYATVDSNHEFADKSIKVWVKLVEIEDEDEEHAWSGVQIETYDEGDGINYPSTGDMVTVKYVGMLASDGKVFDSSEDTGPLEFQLGTGKVIKGWDEGLKRLTLGEKARLFIASEFAYGSKGAGDEIPPNANLVFDVHLIKINDKEII